MADTWDIVVVGGGVIGTSLAFSLARRRTGRVLLLEKAFLGAGASGKAAAIISQIDSHPLSAALSKQSLAWYEHFPERVGGPPVFARTGLVLVGNDSERPALTAVQETLRQDLGLELPLVGSEELMDIDPNGYLGEQEWAVFEKEAGFVQPVQVIASYAESARREGAEVRQGVEVQRIMTSKGKVIGIITNEGACGCGMLVLAAGAWSTRLLRDHRVSLPVEPWRTQMALFHRPPDWGRRGVIYADQAQGFYFRPGYGELILAGSLTRDGWEHPVDPDHFSEAPAGDWLPRMRQRLSRRYPPMHRGYGRGGYGGLAALTPDGRPILDRLPGLDNLYVAAGFGGHAFRLAPLAGDLLAGWVVTGKPGPVDLTPFRLARFEQNEPIASGLVGENMS